MAEPYVVHGPLPIGASRGKLSAFVRRAGAMQERAAVSTLGAIMPSWPTLFVFVAAVVAAAFSGAFFKPGAWYRALAKPRWNPPDWVFPPAWTVLYLMIAIAGALAWEAGGGRWNAATSAWVVQLVFNAAWSWAFFGMQRIALAFAISFGMLAGIVAFILLAYPASPWAAGLFLPYLAWVAFATTLTGSILRRNPGSRPAGSGSASGA